MLEESKEFQDKENACKTIYEHLAVMNEMNEVARTVAQEKFAVIDQSKWDWLKQLCDVRGYLDHLKGSISAAAATVESKDEKVKAVDEDKPAIDDDE